MLPPGCDYRSRAWRLMPRARRLAWRCVLELVVPYLLEQGHGVVVMELPCADLTATFSDYAQVVCDAP